MQTQKVLVLSVLSLLLASCGGGKSDEKTAQNNEPIRITATNWTKPTQSSRITSAPSVSVSNGKFKVVITDDNISPNDHVQIYLNTDNNSATGFQFTENAWTSRSGADYLIEDRDIYTSKANDGSWSWSDEIGVANVTRHNNTITLETPVTTFKGLCKKFTIGIIRLNNSWTIEDYYPRSNSMAKKSFTYCDSGVNNTPPVVTLGTTAPLVINLNTTFVIPAATAHDQEDGDISAAITTVSTVNTAVAGNYTVTYSVKDSGGLTAIPMIRNVIVIDPNAPVTITVDGNASDWSTITPFAQSGGNIIKLTDSPTHLYVLVNAINLGANTSVFIDSDGNASTGYSTNNGGVDYYIENTEFNRFTGTNSSQWSWSIGGVTVPVVRNQNILELAIPKSALSNLTNTPKINFISINGNWVFNYALPTNLKQYNLKYPISSNHAPVAANDSAATTATAPVTINAVANDTDADNDNLTITSVTTPAHGSAVIVANKIKYTAGAGFVGTDTFNYTISDGHGHTATASISVVVASGNVAPVAVNDSANTTNTTAFVTINAIANDTDANSDPLTITQVTTPAHGTASIVANKIKYVPAANFVGNVSFNYTISDGHGHTASATITIHITSGNQAPVAVNDSVTMTNAVSKNIAALTNDSDPDNDVLTITHISTPAHGTTLKSGTHIIYTPTVNYAGADTFTYTISDGHGHTATATVSVNVVITTNHAPDAVEDAPSTGFHDPILIDVLANDTDPDNDPLTIVSFTQPLLGGSVTKVGTKLRFDPQGIVGSNSFSYIISDGHGHTDTAVVTVATVDPNDDSHSSYPNLVNDNVTTTKNHSILINVLANDSDSDGDTIHLDQVDTPDHGTTVKTNGKVLYTPAPGFVGTDTFYYGAHDGYGHGGSALVTITVTP